MSVKALKTIKEGSKMNDKELKSIIAEIVKEKMAELDKENTPRLSEVDQELVNEKIKQAQNLRVSVVLLDCAVIKTLCSGAVFDTNKVLSLIEMLNRDITASNINVPVKNVNLNYKEVQAMCARVSKVVTESTRPKKDIPKTRVRRKTTGVRKVRRPKK